MKRKLDGKRAYVGGASRGLGCACATELARQGARVVVASRNEEALAESAKRIAGETGAQVIPIAADQNDRSSVEALCARIDEAFGGRDIMVTNTGGPPPGDFFTHDEGVWQESFDRLLMYVVRMMRHFVPGMRERKWGRIVNITSMSVKEPAVNLVLSNTFRVGVVSMSKALSRQVIADGVTINNVCPGGFDTERSRELLAAAAERTGRSAEELRAESEASLPMGRILDPPELATLVAFLASDEARAITGTTIPVDGGEGVGLL